MQSAVRPLFEGPIDVVGDVHGEIRALESLLAKLGYDEGGRHAEGRRLVFVGDLIDRGPDSPAVLRKVMRLVAAGMAQCIAGNHELNALRNDPHKRRAGEGWWYERRDDPADVTTRIVSGEEKEDVFLPFLRGLPGALERADLRVVHACWDPESIEDMRATSSVFELYREHQQMLEPKLREMRHASRRALDDAGLEEADLRKRDLDPPLLRERAEFDRENQMGNAAKVVTSGVERVAGRPFYSSGKWRMVERHRWWEGYDDVPVVVGHYWRRYSSDHLHGPEKADSDLFGSTPASAWLGAARRVMCIDYSVGFRFEERQRAGAEGPFDGCLAALRVPEWRLVFDDHHPEIEIGPPGGEPSGA